MDEILVCSYPDTTEDHITVTQGVYGYFAILLRWNSDIECYEPEQTSNSYATVGAAQSEAKAWAMAEGLPYR